MRCEHCDYLLFNLTQPVCPECGRGFDIETYRFDPGAVSFNCPQCDQEYYGNDASGLPQPRKFQCVQCKQPVILQQMRVVPKHPEAKGEPRCRSPWDRRRELGTFKAWWETSTMTLVRPGAFFRTHSGRSIREAWYFSMTACYIGILPSFFYQILFLWGIGGILTRLTPTGGGPAPALPPLGLFAAFYAAMGIFLPLLIPFIGGGIWACTIHLALYFLAPARKPIDDTFRTAMYSFGPYALYIVPGCGGYIGGVWQLVTLIIGVKEVHRVSGPVASIAVLWPIALLLAVYAMSMSFFLAGAFA